MKPPTPPNPSGHLSVKQLPPSSWGFPCKERGVWVRAGRQGAGSARWGLTCQQQQQLPQAVLVQVQGVLLPTGLLLQPDTAVSRSPPRFLPAPPGPSHWVRTLAMAAEATSSAARRRGLSRAISGMGAKALGEGSSLFVWTPICLP